MVISTNLIGKGIALGLGAAVPIGPVNVEIARRTLRGGFLAGFALGLGAVTIDVTDAILSSLSLGGLLNRPQIRGPITIGGIVFLLYLAAMCLRGAIRDFHADPLAAAPATASRRAAYVTGLLMTFLNPMTIAFWFVVVPAIVGTITKEPRRDLPMICGGVFIGTVAWVIGFAGALSSVGKWRRGWWLAAADGAGGLLLFGFAVSAIWRALRPIL